MKGEFTSFSQIKEAVPIERVLSDYGVRLRRVGSCLRGPCSLPTHSSKRSSESFVVYPEKGVWVCYSASCIAARGGRAAGDVLDYVASVEGCSLREAALKLKARYQDASSSSECSRSPSGRTTTTSSGPERQSSPVNRPLPFSLQGIDSTHPYLKHRGIAIETADYFGVGLFRGSGCLSGRIVFPICDGAGRLIGYAGRSIDGSEPRYKLPTGFVKSAVLYNLHHVRPEAVTLVLVEGFFGCMKVHQAGVPDVAALMGCSLSKGQQDLLARFRSIVLLLDGDEAGREAAPAIASRLVYSHFVRLIDLADGMEPDSLPADELRALLSV